MRMSDNKPDLSQRYKSIKSKKVTDIPVFALIKYVVLAGSNTS